jgi:asparagine synthase (glutamine-hydrolysing)
MCGINGIFSYHYAAGAASEAELIATRDHMSRRGPDGAGAWWHETRRVGLGHRRLSIIDLSDRAAQPMASGDGGLVVTFNGEIYNFAELKAELQAQGRTFRTNSDTEVLLHMYAVHGPEMVRRLRGMFAFAIWDEAREGLFLARDPYGIKPLYTANDGWTFRFASQVKALLAGGKVSRDPEPAGLIGFHLWGSVPAPFTLYREIRGLPAGHTQWIDRLGPREPESYLRLAEVLAEGARAPAPAAEVGRIIREATLDSVRAHLVADVEVGVFLSAGVDSGALLGLMRDAGQRDIRAITLAFEEFRGRDEDEAPLAAKVAQLYGAKHVVRRVGRREFDEDLPAILDAMDQPSIDGVNTWFVAKAAREAGLKVALSGVGGDELFAGYPSFRDVPRWVRWFAPTRVLPGLGGTVRRVGEALAPGLKRSLPKALSLVEYGGSYPGAYLLRRGLFLPNELEAMLDRDLVREGLRRLKPLRALARSITPDPGTPVGRLVALESNHYLRHQLLRDADWAGMAHSLEIRTPLVDIELLRRLAPVMPRISTRTGKRQLAAAASTPLPAEIVERSKTGFGVPTGEWLPTETGGPARAIAKGASSRAWALELVRRGREPAPAPAQVQAKAS